MLRHSKHFFRSSLYSYTIIIPGAAASYGIYNLSDRMMRGIHGAPARHSQLVVIMKYWNREMETLKGDALHAFQAKRLRWTVEQAGKVPFYRKVLREAGVRPEDIRTVDDVQKLPFTRKTDLQGGYPFGFFCGADEGGRADSHHIRNDRKTDGGRIHPAGFG